MAVVVIATAASAATAATIAILSFTWWFLLEGFWLARFGTRAYLCHYDDGACVFVS